MWRLRQVPTRESDLSLREADPEDRSQQNSAKLEVAARCIFESVFFASGHV